MNNIFIRHGEVENPKDIYYVNIPGYKLSKRGENQAEQAGIYLKNKGYNFNIITSPLLRARQTAEIISKILSTEINTDIALYEWMGPVEWRGLSFDEINKEKTSKIKSEEEYLDVYKRIKKIYDKFDKTIFISHQDAIRSFTYFEINDQTQDFFKFKPTHCEAQVIDYQNQSIEKIFIPN